MGIDTSKVVNLKDITGQRFGLLTVQEYLGRSKWRCLCDCGNITITQTQHLKNGHTMSCGCWKLQRISETHKKHGESRSRLFKVWGNMKKRCYNPNDKHFYRYGGRGITVCEEWRQSFEAFREWANANGYTDELTIDRIENNKGYSPENCRWATAKTQSNNRSTNRLLTFNGETKTLAQWSEEAGMKPRTLTRRLDRWKWSIADALTIPVQATTHKKDRVNNGN